jgi:hypothetical protein
MVQLDNNRANCLMSEYMYVFLQDDIFAAKCMGQ